MTLKRAGRGSGGHCWDAGSIPPPHFPFSFPFPRGSWEGHRASDSREQWPLMLTLTMHFTWSNTPQNQILKQTEEKGLDFLALWLAHSALCAWPRVLQVLQPEAWRSGSQSAEPTRVQWIPAVQLRNVLGLRVKSSKSRVHSLTCVCKEGRETTCVGRGARKGKSSVAPQKWEGPLAETLFWLQPYQLSYPGPLRSLSSHLSIYRETGTTANWEAHLDHGAYIVLASHDSGVPGLGQL